ncbi:MAG: ABC transporter permease [Crenarchaeota archaeon]|nr:ABC transporter permease [Thermoproteota archaeon]
MRWISVIGAMAIRQLKRFFRARARALSTIMMPLMWLLLFGIGFSTAFRGVGFRSILGTSYISFLVPGIVCMTMFVSSFMSGISVIWDRQFGFLKEVLVAPAPRTFIILGRVLGDVTTSLIQALLIMVIGIALAHSLYVYGIPVALIYCLLLGMIGAGLGTMLALSINSIEAFQALVSFIILPLNFISNIFYPLNRMPTWFKIPALLNPITYATDALRGLLIHRCVIGLGIDSIVLIVVACVVIVLAAYMFRRTSIE